MAHIFFAESQFRSVVGPSLLAVLAESAGYNQFKIKAIVIYSTLSFTGSKHVTGLKEYCLLANEDKTQHAHFWSNPLNNEN